MDTSDFTYRKTLEMHLRHKLSKYLDDKYLKKEFCELCNSTEQLQSHHEEFRFADIMDKALKLLSLDYRKYANEYSKEELEKITYMTMGIDVCFKRVTLCFKCHLKAHVGREEIKLITSYRQKYTTQITYLNLREIEYNLKDLQNNFNRWLLDDICKEYKNVKMTDIILEVIKNKILELFLPIPNVKIKVFDIDFFEKLLKYYGVPYSFKKIKSVNKTKLTHPYLALIKISKRNPDTSAFGIRKIRSS
jgi:hypothetical protein